MQYTRYQCTSCGFIYRMQEPSVGLCFKCGKCAEPIKQENIVHMAITRAQAQEYARQLDELASDPATYSQMAPLLNEIEATYGQEGMDAVSFQGKLNKMKRQRDEMDKEAIEAFKRYDQKQAERWNNLFSS